jgi:hypothetical protein
VTKPREETFNVGLAGRTISLLDNSWRKRNGRTEAALLLDLTVRFHHTAVEMESNEFDDDVAVAAVVVEAAVEIITIQIVSQRMSRVMLHWKRVMGFWSCIPTVMDFCVALRITTRGSGQIRLCRAR